MRKHPRRIRTSVLTPVLILISALQLRAQPPPSVTADSLLHFERVRVQLSEPIRDTIISEPLLDVEGQVFNVRPDTLLFTRPNRPAVAVPLDRIERTSVMHREGGSIYPGFLIGPPAGFVAVWMWGRMQYGSAGDVESWNRVAGVIYGAPAGFVVGSVVSYFMTREERWVEVRIEPSGGERSGTAPGVEIGVVLEVF